MDEKKDLFNIPRMDQNNEKLDLFNIPSMN